jgi:hypothetical protein
MLVKAIALILSKTMLKSLSLILMIIVSVVRSKDLEYQPMESVIRTLKNASYAAIFTEGNIGENNSTDILGQWNARP